MSRYFIIPDPSNSKISICLMAFDTEDYVCKVCKDPIYFSTEPKLYQLLGSKSSFIQAELERSDSIDIFCKRLYDLISKLRPHSIKTTSNLQSNYYRKVIDEIRNIGWFRIQSIDTSLSFFEVALSDQKQRKIEIRFDLPPNFPYSKPTVTSNLPIQIAFDWDPQTTTLLSIIEKYETALPSFDDLWTQLEDIDKNCYVIDPRKPTLNCCMRLLYLSPQLWCQIEVKPLRVSFKPIIKFKGADQKKREMQQKFERNGHWDQELTIRKNLENILELKLPKKPEEDDESTEIECSICFCERFGGELPEIICENQQCAKHYHRSCLLEWLRENRKAEQGTNVIYGTCPNCGTKIEFDI